MGYGQGSPFGKLRDCVLLIPEENDKNQDSVVGDSQDWDAGNVEDMCLDSLEEHILLLVDQSRQLEDCTMVEEHEVAHLHGFLE